jgi:Holliday junction resolvase RusA-like endonuclease
MIQLTFPGEPKAIQSARFCRIGNYIKSYQPKEVTSWKAYIRLLALEQLTKTSSFVTLEGGIFLIIDFVFSPLKNWPKYRMEQLNNGIRFYKTTRPDLADNLCKGLIDALNGLVWKDDAQIVKVESRKYFGIKPHIKLVVIPFEKDEYGEKQTQIKEEEIF